MPLSPSATRETLARLGHAPKRFLGQNFLVDGNIVRKSLTLAEVVADDTIIEIGPGLGTLTSALLETGADVWAVEKDRALHAHLATELAPRFASRFHLHEGDAVELPLAGWTGPDGGCKVVANLPYAIATPWMDAVLTGPLPSRMVLMLQQEAAQRYLAEPGSKSFGAISIFLRSAYDVFPGHDVAAACFHPRPEVESHLLNLRLRAAPFRFSAAAKALLRACFQQRRKQLGAVLRQRLPSPLPWREILAAHGLDERVRAEQVPIPCWQAFAAAVNP
ncbi:MAG: Ribosomal small subunit methyltransferase [Verrucomicrobiota bacterium]|jgi:16S rRNA (adenine1518-N6/adenine1519-N6)-dimethyltransferase